MHDPEDREEFKKGNKKNKQFAGSAGIRGSEKRWATAPGAMIYQPERVIGADFEMVRDAGFEPATSCV